MVKKSLVITLFFTALLVVFSQIALASISLRVLIVNPSKESKQKIPVKVMLPKEIKPEDVLDAGDLEIGYDTSEGAYFVFGDVELGPGQTLEREIELRDIWVIPEAEIISIQGEAEKLFEILKRTEYYERANYLKNSIDQRLEGILESQKSPPANPEEHISNYRNNLTTLAEVKTDLALAKNLLAKAGPLSSVKLWKIVLVVIIFLGLIGGSFYFIWARQAGKIVSEIPQENKTSSDEELIKEAQKQASEGEKET
jgi:hypothetical protein